VKLVKFVGPVTGPQNVPDTLTKSLPRPAFEKHRGEFMVGTTLRVPYSAFYANVAEALEPVVAYVIKLPIPKYSKKRPVSYCVGA
jgi:hypothetical protein